MRRTYGISRFYTTLARRRCCPTLHMCERRNYGVCFGRFLAIVCRSLLECDEQAELLRVIIRTGELTYDDAVARCTALSPKDVLSLSVTDTLQPGLLNIHVAADVMTEDVFRVLANTSRALVRPGWRSAWSVPFLDCMDTTPLVQSIEKVFRGDGKEYDAILQTMDSEEIPCAALEKAVRTANVGAVRALTARNASLCCDDDETLRRDLMHLVVTGASTSSIQAMCDFLANARKRTYDDHCTAFALLFFPLAVFDALVSYCEIPRFLSYFLTRGSDGPS